MFVFVFNVYSFNVVNYYLFFSTFCILPCCHNDAIKFVQKRLKTLNVNNKHHYFHVATLLQKKQSIMQCIVRKNHNSISFRIVSLVRVTKCHQNFNISLNSQLD